MSFAENKNIRNTPPLPPMRQGDQSQDSDDVIQPAVQEKSVRTTTYILVCVVIAVLAGVFFVSRKSAPKKASAVMSDQQVKIETAIAQLTGIKTEGLEQVDKMVRKFHEYAEFQQVLPSQLKRDPFNMSWAFTDSAAKSSQDRLQQQAEKMVLQSIMKSKYGNCCMIDGVLLYEGDEINGFTVTKIGDDFVRMNAEHKTVVLELKTQ